MKHLLLLFISLTVFLVSCGDDEDSPTSPEEFKTDTFLPLAVGNEWYYTIKEHNDGKVKTNDLLVSLVEKKTIEYQNQKLDAYKQIQSRFNDNDDGQWNFIYNSQIVVCKNLEDLEHIDTFPQTISFEDGNKLDSIKFGKKYLKVSVSTITVMDMSMKCIKLREETKEYVSDTYYKHGLGLVKVEHVSILDDFDYSMTMTLKNYKIK